MKYVFQTLVAICLLLLFADLFYDLAFYIGRLKFCRHVGSDRSNLYG